jgi:hypothetical protein
LSAETRRLRYRISHVFLPGADADFAVGPLRVFSRQESIAGIAYRRLAGIEPRRAAIEQIILFAIPALERGDQVLAEVVNLAADFLAELSGLVDGERMRFLGLVGTAGGCRMKALGYGNPPKCALLCSRPVR